MAKKAAPKAAGAKAANAAKAGADKSAKAAAPGVKPRSATKSEVYSNLAEKTNLTKKQVASVFDALGEMIHKELSKKGPGQFTIPGLLKLKVVEKKATPARQGKNPFTGEPMMIKAKPARKVVKAVPLKSLKESV
ncbi:MAG: HU family DNA-binding protein [Isosphaeraceae bacterium]|nr:HU family DNA-binding protein [Isosphaeraceae bacterium]